MINLLNKLYNFSKTRKKQFSIALQTPKTPTILITKACPEAKNNTSNLTLLETDLNGKSKIYKISKNSLLSIHLISTLLKFTSHSKNRIKSLTLKKNLTFLITLPKRETLLCPILTMYLSNSMESNFWESKTLKMESKINLSKDTKSMLQNKFCAWSGRLI